MIILTFPFSMILCIKIIKEYERAIIFRLGRVKDNETVGPGLFFILPCIDQVNYKYFDLHLKNILYISIPKYLLDKGN